MTICLNMRATMMGLALSTMLVLPSLAGAQMTGGMGHNEMMPMGDGKMGGEMPMPAKMPPKKPGCCGKMGGMAAKPAAMPATHAKPHKHRAKTKPKHAAAPAKPMATAKPATTAKPASAMPMPAKPAPMTMPMPDQMPPKKPGCC